MISRLLLIASVLLILSLCSGRVGAEERRSSGKDKAAQGSDTKATSKKKIGRGKVKVSPRGHKKVDAKERILDKFTLVGRSELPVQTKQDWNKALSEYKEKEKVSADSFEIAYNIALCEARLGIYDSAEESIKKCVRLNPLYGSGFSLMSAIYRLQGKDYEADQADLRSKQL